MATALRPNAGGGQITAMGPGGRTGNAGVTGAPGKSNAHTYPCNRVGVTSVKENTRLPKKHFKLPKYLPTY